MSYQRNLARLARKGVITVNTVQELRDLTIYGNDYPEIVETLGALSVGDGGGQKWVWDPNSTATPNFRIIQLTGVVTGRYVVTDPYGPIDLREITGFVNGDDIGNALQQAIDYSVETLQKSLVSGTGVRTDAPMLMEIKVPTGHYKTSVNHQYVFPAAPGMQHANTLKISGSGRGATVFECTGANQVFFATWGSTHVVLENFQIIGNFTDADTVGLQFGNLTDFTSGRSADYVAKQSSIRDIHLEKVNKGIVCGALYDSIIEQVLMRDLIGQNARGIQFLPSACQEWSNGIVADNIHIEGFEKAIGASIGIEFNASGNSIGACHHDMQWDDVHIETRTGNCQPIVFDNASSITFVSPRVIQSRCETSHTNDPVVECKGSGIQNATFLGGSIRRTRLSGTQGRKLIELATAISNPSFSVVSAVLKDDSVIAPSDWRQYVEVTDLQLRGFGLNNVVLGNAGTSPYVNQVIVSSGAQHVGFSWRGNVNNNRELLLHHMHDATVDDHLHAPGIFSAYGMAGFIHSAPNGAQARVANGASLEYEIPNAGANPNGVGVAIIFAGGNPAQGWCMVAFGNNNVVPVVPAGARWSVAAADPNTPNTYNVFMNGKKLTVTNRYGADTDIAIIPFSYR